MFSSVAYRAASRGNPHPSDRKRKGGKSSRSNSRSSSHGCGKSNSRSRSPSPSAGKGLIPEMKSSPDSQEEQGTSGGKKNSLGETITMNMAYIPDEKFAKNLGMKNIYEMEKYHLSNVARGINHPLSQTYRDHDKAIEIWFKRKYEGYKKGDWKNYPVEFFFERLKLCAQPRDQDDPLDLARRAASKLRLLPGDYDSLDVVAKYITSIVDALASAGVYNKGTDEHKMSETLQAAFCRDLFDRLPQNTATDNKFRDKVRILCNNGKFTTLDDYLDAVNEIFNDFIMGRNRAVDQGYDLEPSPVKNFSGESSAGKGSDQKSKKRSLRAKGWQANKSLKETGEEFEDEEGRKSSPVSSESAVKSDSSSKKTNCYGCGGVNHKKADCRLKKHPGYNDTSENWKSSDKGKAYLKNCKSDKLIIGKTPAGKKCDWDSSYGKKKGESNDLSFNHCNVFSTLVESCSIIELKQNTPHNLMLSCHVSPSVSSMIKLMALVDTGAQDCSYISQRLASNLEELGIKGSSTHRRVCGGLTNSCMTFNQQYSIDLTFVDEIFNLNTTIRLENVVAISSPFDCIIGLPDIKKFRLYDVILWFDWVLGIIISN